MAAFSAVARFSGDDRFSNVLARMGANTKRFESKSRASFARVEQSALKLRKRIAGIGSQLKTLVAFGGITGLLLTGAQAIKEYDTNMASLQAITGATSTELVGFKANIASVAKQTKKSVSDIAKGFELVGSAKPELLANAEALGEVTRQAILLGQAGRLETEPAVKALTVSMNQFGVGADQAAKFTDILATAQQKGSGTIGFLAQAMVNAGGTAKAFGNSFEDTVAILEGFAKAGTPASEAGTQLSGILSKLSKVSNRSFNPQFTKATDIIKNLSKANLSYNQLLKLTDAEGAKWLTTIINQNDVVQKLKGNLNETGNAQSQAAINTATLSSKFQQLTDAFGNAVVGSTENSSGMKLLGGAMDFVANNLDWIVSLLAGFLAVAVPVLGIVKALKGAQWLYNTAVGVGAFLQGKSAFALKGNAKALASFGKVSKIATAAQWAFNAAAAANPIGLIVIAIAAVVAAIVALVSYWDEIGEIWSKTPTWVKFVTLPIQLMLSPLLILANLIRKIIDNWGGIKKAFTDGGFIAGMKKLGGVILSALIDPIVFLLELLAKIPGVGGFVNPVIESVEAFQARAEGGFGVDQELGIGSAEEPVNTQRTESIVREEQVNRGVLDINFNDPLGRASVNPETLPSGITVNSTTNNF